MRCPIVKIADFLLYLFEVKKLTPGTISGYKTAISTTWAKAGDNSLISNNTLASLIRSFHIERPKPNNFIPKWNLALVLDAFTKPPFEPLQSISIHHLTVKTVFLTALASGRRRGELHAIVLDGSGKSDNNQSFTLAFDRLFIAKSERLHRRFAKSLVIPSLQVSCQEEVALCPVRALDHYVQRTKTTRALSSAQKLFVSYKQDFKGEIAPQTISRWLTNAIIWAYEATEGDKEQLTLHRVKAHDVRAMAASVALHRAASLEDILAAACWANHTTFTSFYLRDLSLQSQDLHRLGPIVASQQVLQ